MPTDLGYLFEQERRAIRSEDCIMPASFPICGHSNYGRRVLVSVRFDCETCKQFYCAVCDRIGSHACPNCFNGIEHGFPQDHRCRAIREPEDGELVEDIVDFYWREVREQQRIVEEAQREEERRREQVSMNTRVRLQTMAETLAEMNARLGQATTRAAEAMEPLAEPVAPAPQYYARGGYIAATSPRQHSQNLATWATYIQRNYTWRS